MMAEPGDCYVCQESGPRDQKGGLAPRSRVTNDCEVIPEWAYKSDIEQLVNNKRPAWSLAKLTGWHK